MFLQGIPGADTLVNLGVLGIVFLLLLTDILVTGARFKEMKAERDRYRDLNERVIRSIETVPAATEANLEMLETILGILEDLQSRELE